MLNKKRRKIRRLQEEQGLGLRVAWFCHWPFFLFGLPLWSVSNGIRLLSRFLTLLGSLRDTEFIGLPGGEVLGFGIDQKLSSDSHTCIQLSREPLIPSLCYFWLTNLGCFTIPLMRRASFQNPSPTVCFPPVLHVPIRPMHTSCGNEHCSAAVVQPGPVLLPRRECEVLGHLVGETRDAAKFLTILRTAPTIKNY